MRLGAEIYICESETVRHKYSTRKSELEKEKDRETTAEAVLPATPPAQRTTKGSGVRNVENLPNRSKVRDSERVKKYDEGAATFNDEKPKVKEEMLGWRVEDQHTQSTQRDLNEPIYGVSSRGSACLRRRPMRCGRSASLRP